MEDRKERLAVLKARHKPAMDKVLADFRDFVKRQHDLLESIQDEHMKEATRRFLNRP